MSRKGVKAIDRQEIYKAIEMERDRQERLHPLPRIKKTDDPELMAMQKYIQTAEYLAVLIEEVGEVGRAIQGEGNLQEELIQVASVCFRILELENPAE